LNYATEDISRQDSNPVLLFAFTRGSESWYYAASTQAVTLSGHSYLPEAVSCEDIVSTGEIPKDALSITLPVSNPLAASFLAYTPDAYTIVTVFSTSLTATSPSSRVEWKGRVLNVRASVATMTLTCEPVSQSLLRLGLRETYQHSCRHMLFGPGCNVDAATVAHSVTVTGVTGSRVTLSAPALGYVGGNLKAPDGTFRMVISQNTDGSVLTLMRVVKSLVDSLVSNPSGFTATLYPGCDKSTTTCRDIFHNLGNFGGFPGITSVNPFSGSSNVF
jgi:hypothetical protein